MSLALAPDGSTLAAAGNNGTADLWDLATGQRRATLQDPGAPRYGIHSLSFSPDGTTVVGHNAGEICRWVAFSGRRIRATDQPDMGPCRAAVAPDGRTLVTASGQQALQLWEARSGRFVGTLGRHEECSRVVFSPDGNLVATGGSRDGTVRLWQVPTGQERGRFKAAAQCAAFSPDGRWLVTADEAGTFRLYELATGRQVWEVRDPWADPATLAISPDGQVLAWVPSPLPPVAPAAVRRERHEPWISVREAATGRELRRLVCPGPCLGAAFAPDGRTLAAATAVTIELWDTRSWQRVAWLEGSPATPHRDPPPANFRALAFAPDGQTLAAETAEHGIRLWDLATGRVRLDLLGHEAPILSLAFAPDGRTLISGSDDTTALVWQLPPPAGMSAAD
jgi:WD40 repeat protein